MDLFFPKIMKYMSIYYRDLGKNKSKKPTFWNDYSLTSKYFFQKFRTQVDTLHVCMYVWIKQSEEATFAKELLIFRLFCKTKNEKKRKIEEIIILLYFDLILGRCPSGQTPSPHNFNSDLPPPPPTVFPHRQM